MCNHSIGLNSWKVGLFHVLAGLEQAERNCRRFWISYGQLNCFRKLLRAFWKLTERRWCHLSASFWHIFRGALWGFRFQSFLARNQTSQQTYRRVLRVSDLGLKALGLVFGPCWSGFGASHELDDSPKVTTWVTRVPWRSFLKDVSSGITVLAG